MPKTSVKKTPAAKTSSRPAKESKKHILMVASENGALVGGKVGGIADVVRDLPPALAALGYKVTVVTPNYGFLDRDNPVTNTSTVTFPFCEKTESAAVYRVKASKPVANVAHVLIENVWIRGDPIYIHDGEERPFASDASKFALFCSAVGQLIVSGHKDFKDVSVIHLHDWHAATLLLLRRLHPAFESLKKIRTVFTIHNLGIQGTRPIQGHESSLAAWFPELVTNPDIASELYNHYADFRFNAPCYTPMAVGIALADAVNTVSPTYAKEILAPSNHQNGTWGGEGLEWIVRAAQDEKRLFGILNGIDYPARRKPPVVAFPRLLELIKTEVEKEAAAKPDNPHLPAALKRIEEWEELSPAVLLTSVTRTAEQKVKLFFKNGYENKTALASVLEKIRGAGGVFILLGEGLPEYENELGRAMFENPNFLFLNLTSAAIAEHLYANGRLFLMPSLYEPCGIAQMLAMRDGQLPIVNAVGGLKDTVSDRKNGFVFAGQDWNERVQNFIEVLSDALRLFTSEPEIRTKLVEQAKAARFLWSEAAAKYAEEIYRLK